MTGFLWPDVNPKEVPHDPHEKTHHLGGLPDFVPAPALPHRTAPAGRQYAVSHAPAGIPVRVSVRPGLGGGRRLSGAIAAQPAVFRPADLPVGPGHDPGIADLRPDRGPGLRQRRAHRPPSLPVLSRRHGGRTLGVGRGPLPAGWPERLGIFLCHVPVRRAPDRLAGYPAAVNSARWKKQNSSAHKNIGDRLVSDIFSYQLFTSSTAMDVSSSSATCPPIWFTE